MVKAYLKGVAVNVALCGDFIEVIGYVSFKYLQITNSYSVVAPSSYFGIV